MKTLPCSQLQSRFIISTALDEIAESVFATFGSTNAFIDPQLIVDPCGPITLPLNDVDASRIIAASHQALFGKGSHTIIDTTVRRTWEINGDVLKMQNQQGFQRLVDGALERVCKAFGLVDRRENVEAELYKLLLYEKGAMFKPHTEYVAPNLSHRQSENC